MKRTQIVAVVDGGIVPIEGRIVPTMTVLHENRSIGAEFRQVLIPYGQIHLISAAIEFDGIKIVLEQGLYIGTNLVMALGIIVILLRRCTMIRTDTIVMIPSGG